MTLDHNSCGDTLSREKGCDVVRSSASLHERVRLALAADIRVGRFSVTGRLPAEPELCERFGVSRITVRRAVADLESQGLVVRRQGAGTFVTEAPELLGTMAIGGFADQFSADGTKSRRVMRAAVGRATALDAQRLEVREGSEVFRLERVFLVGGVALSVDRSIYSLERYPGFDEKVAGDVSTYKILREDYGVHFAEVHREITVGYTDVDTSLWLDRPENDPLLVVEKIAVDRDGAIIHHSHVETVPSRVTLKMSAREERRETQ